MEFPFVFMVQNVRCIVSNTKKKRMSRNPCAVWQLQICNIWDVFLVKRHCQYCVLHAEK